MHFHDYTGQDCSHGHPTFYQVVEMSAWGTSTQEISRRGPTCWYADCPDHHRWCNREAS